MRFVGGTLSAIRDLQIMMMGYRADYFRWLSPTGDSKGFLP